MLFQTTQAHEELRAKIRAFAETEVKPNAILMDQESRFPAEAIKKFAEMGLMGIPYPNEYGGAGLDVMSYAIAVEELSRVDGGTGVILSAHVSLGTWPIFAFGTEEQKQKYLVPLAKGEKIGAFGLTEPNAGSDAGGTETTAIDKGDHWLLTGQKIFITNGGVADTYVVFAVTTPDIGTRGISAFIVEKGWKGFTFEPHYDKMGIRSSETCQLNFDDVKVPKENLLGKEGQGFKIAMATLDGGRIGIASQALGIAQGAYESAVEYAKERVQFGKPIGFNQALTFKLADMATKLKCARMLVYSTSPMAWTPPWPSCTPPRPPSRSSTTRCRFMAAPASSRAWMWSGCTATRKSPLFMRAPAKSSAWLSARPSWASPPRARAVPPAAPRSPPPSPACVRA